jgi:predicted anti-sigma-YlaC factor YlaD
MKCNEIREQLPDLAAGFVAGQAEINEHLRSCTECAGAFAELQKTMALLDEWQAPEPSPYFETRLQARLREEMERRSSPWFTWGRRPALAASLAAIVAVGAVVLRLEQTKTRNNPGPVATVAEPGTAVGDLQALENNQDVYADSDLMDDLQPQQDDNANP